jgi:hypothetical protein
MVRTVRRTLGFDSKLPVNLQHFDEKAMNLHAIAPIAPLSLVGSLWRQRRLIFESARRGMVGRQLCDPATMSVDLQEL